MDKLDGFDSAAVENPWSVAIAKFPPKLRPILWSRTAYEAKGTSFEFRMISSRVSRGILCTTLVAAMISSAGSLPKSRRVEARATARSIGHTCNRLRTRIKI